MLLTAAFYHVTLPRLTVMKITIFWTPLIALSWNQPTIVCDKRRKQINNDTHYATTESIILIPNNKLVLLIWKKTQKKQQKTHTIKKPNTQPKSKSKTKPKTTAHSEY